MDPLQEHDQKMGPSAAQWPEMNQFPYFFNPYYQMMQFYPVQPESQSRENLKIVKQFGVQTEKSYISHPEAMSSGQSDSNSEEEGLKQFPLPNKEKLFQLFQCRSGKRKDINQIIAQLCSDKSKALNNFYKAVGEKVISFKKTKEEIIKFLVRRAWKKQNEGPGQAREKYYAEFKSMNFEYLSVVFKEPTFVAAYEDMLENFDSQFDVFNLQRFNRFYDFLLHCYVNSKLTLFKMSKECKNKLPYPLQWKIHIEEIAQNLYETYYGKSGQRKKGMGCLSLGNRKTESSKSSQNSENN